MSSITGQCLCGQITVSVTEEVMNNADNIAACHCKNCCRAGGCVGSINVVAPENAVEITGEPSIYEDGDTGSGTPLQRAFCGTCGSPIFTASPNTPGVQVIKLGLFDNIPKPSAELYCKSRPCWEKPVDGAKQFNEMPPK